MIYARWLSETAAQKHQEYYKVASLIYTEFMCSISVAIEIPFCHNLLLHSCCSYSYMNQIEFPPY